MKFKSLLVVTVLALSMGAVAQVTVSVAPDAPSREDVEKLFQVMGSREQVRQVMREVYAQMREMNRDEMKKRRPEISDEEVASVEREAEDLIKNFPVDEMLNDMIPVYQRHFTKAEIEGLADFYSSTLGQKVLHEMPAVTAESLRIVYPRIEKELDSVMKQAEEKKEKKEDSPAK